VVTAEIGKNPAWVDVGGEPGQIDRTMSWEPASGSNVRRGLALIPVNAKGQFSLRYEHGSRIDVDVLGYFSGDRATKSVARLYVPSKPATVFEGVAGPQGSRIDVPEAASAVFVDLTGEKGLIGRLPAYDVGISSGRTIGTTLPAADGKTEIRAGRPLSVRATLGATTSRSAVPRARAASAEGVSRTAGSRVRARRRTATSRRASADGPAPAGPPA
jgi:hypothetical protein